MMQVEPNFWVGLYSLCVGTPSLLKCGLFSILLTIRGHLDIEEGRIPPPPPSAAVFSSSFGRGNFFEKKTLPLLFGQKIGLNFAKCLKKGPPVCFWRLFSEVPRGGERGGRGGEGCYDRTRRVKSLTTVSRQVEAKTLGRPRAEAPALSLSLSPRRNSLTIYT